jgi:hypothetical protein
MREHEHALDRPKCKRNVAAVFERLSNPGGQHGRMHASCRFLDLTHRDPKGVHARIVVPRRVEEVFFGQASMQPFQALRAAHVPRRMQEREGPFACQAAACEVQPQR